MEEETLAIEARTVIRGIAAASVLSDLAGVTALAGRASLTAELASRGRSWGELARAFTGDARVEVVDGSLEGMDPVGIAIRMADPLAEPMENPAGEMQFEKLVATVAVADGRLTTEDLAIVADDFTAAVSGWGSVFTGEVNGSAVIHLEEAQFTEEVDVAISGTWREPVVAPVAPRRRPLESPRTGNGG